MRNFKNFIWNNLSHSFQNKLISLYFNFFNPKLVDARNQYNFSDEYLKSVHILEAINYLRIAGNGGKVLPQTYFEFGCHSARTFSAAINAAKLLKIENFKFFAFDSFQGLPETNIEEDGYFQTGTFYTSRSDFLTIIRKKTGIDIPNENIIEGFFRDSLTLELQSCMPKAGIIHIDVDLYSSTVDILNFCKPLLVVGSILIFDDWYSFPMGIELKGERKAFAEFLECNTSIAVEPWKAYSTFGQSFFISKC